MFRAPFLLACALAFTGIALPARAAGGAHTEAGPALNDGRTASERMQSRYPQKVRAGDLVGLPLLDYDDRTLGFVTEVARTPEGGIVLVVPVGGWFGRGGRPVPVPIETVAILGRQIALLDIPRDEVAKLADRTDGAARPVPDDETIRIAITRR